MVAAGELGEIRVVQAEYAQDWLTEPIETTGQKQAALAHRPEAIRRRRLPSATSAPTPTILRCFVTGLKLDALCADLSSFVKGRKLDDNDNMLLRFKGGAQGHAVGKPGGGRQRERR